MFSAFNPSKCTHTWSSGKPTLRRPGSSRGFGALLKGLTSVVDTSCQSRDSNPQIILRSGCSATGNNSFNSLVGTGSNKHVVGLDAVISLFSSSCPIVLKHCSFSLGAMNEAEVLDAVESTFVIVFLILSILSVKKFIKSLLLNCEGIFRSGDICLFVNLATVLNRNLGLFW